MRDHERRGGARDAARPGDAGRPGARRGVAQPPPRSLPRLSAMQPLERSPDPGLRSVVLLALGVAGLALCITLVYLGMRAVMDIGGACADRGPAVSARSPPRGRPGAVVLGAVLRFLFCGVPP